MQMAALSATTSNVWHNMAAYPPHFVQDHVLAAGLWLGLYVCESAGILVNNLGMSYGPLIAWLAALPKTMVPAKFTLAKVLWLRSPYFRAAAQADKELESVRGAPWCHLLAATEMSVASACRCVTESTLHIRCMLALLHRCTAGDLRGTSAWIWQEQCRQLGDVTSLMCQTCESMHAEQGLWTPLLQAVMAPHQHSGSSSASEVLPRSTMAGTQTERRSRQGLKPGEWDPSIGDFARKDIARRSLLQDMYYCVAQVPAGGLQDGQLYEASVMGKPVTFWKGELPKGLALWTRTPMCPGVTLAIMSCRAAFDFANFNLPGPH